MMDFSWPTHKKRPCARDFGFIQFQINKENTMVSVSKLNSKHARTTKVHLSDLTQKDIDGLMDWLQKAKVFFRKDL